MKTPIRHSMLPKLAQCPKYLPKPGPAGPAAERGTRIDKAVRLALQGDRSEIEALPPDEKAPAEWAVQLFLSYKMTGELETREEYLAMHTPGIAHVGTADVLNEHVGWVADLKTGQKRDYYHQLAAYALAVMDKKFLEDFVGHVVYCDERTVISYRFTYAEAKRQIELLLAEVRDPNSQPRACDYCDWCANKDTCPAVVRPVEEGLAVVQGTTSLSEIKDRLLADPFLLGKFLTQWKAVEKEIARRGHGPHQGTGWKAGERGAGLEDQQRRRAASISTPRGFSTPPCRPAPRWRASSRPWAASWAGRSIALGAPASATNR
jgi:hypothetical protein